ncbi:MAG: HAD-IIIC family phosphatase, partial [Promethearchaeota archaeon]
MFEFDFTTLRKKKILIEDSKNFNLKFQKLKDVKYFSFLLWGEHCINCQMPKCYKSCGLYSPRFDGKCRTFIDGIIPMKIKNLKNKSVAMITFKPFSCLWTPANLFLFKKNITIMENIFIYNLKVFQNLSVKKNYILRILKNLILKLNYNFFKCFIKILNFFSFYRNFKPNFFLIEVINPNIFDVGMKISFISKKNQIYEWATSLEPDFNRFFISVKNILNSIKYKSFKSIQLSILRNEPTKLLFVQLNFIHFPERLINKFEKKKKIKCLIWDLDNTIWDGIFVENSNSISIPKLKENIREILEELNKRGILLSIVSKNNYEEIKPILQKLDLWNYFIFPKINWKPKSINIKEIKDSLNIGFDSIGFIDDSEFELNEVKTNLPEVQCYNAKNYKNLLNLPEFAGSKTSIANKRKQLYKTEIKRKELLEQSNNYIEYLKKCKIKLYLSKPKINDFSRIHELIQRTNQMNFSGNRYNQNQIKEILKNNQIKKIIINVKDKYGDYGIVGFCTFSLDPMNKKVQINDLTFSCRVKSKNIEQKFISFMAYFYRRIGYEMLEINYNKTPRNKHLSHILKELNFIFRKGEKPKLFLKNLNLSKYYYLKIKFDWSIFNLR